jgi:hypothetical protein
VAGAVDLAERRARGVGAIDMLSRLARATCLSGRLASPGVADIEIGAG